MKGNAGRTRHRWANWLAVLIAVACASLATAGTAMGAPPSNDDRANAQQIRLGQQVSGTTVDATASTDDRSNCGPVDTPSVWYRIDGSTDGRAIVSLQAGGDLDVVLDVYQRVRSQFNELNCDTSDKKGSASTEFTMKKGQSYLIRVAQQAGSVSGTFSFDVNIGQPPASAPGRALPAGGASGTVQRTFEPSNSWSTHLSEGRTYRINLAPESCMQLSIYGPGTKSFDQSSPVRILRCGGYAQFTPGPHQGGLYSFLIQPASSRRSAQSYHLEVAPAGIDDAVPGVFVRNYQRVHGGLNANRVDVVDLYRFDVTHNSITNLQLSTSRDFAIVLISAGGRRLASATADDRIHLRTRPGRYFVEVRAGRHAVGRYRLVRASKMITKTTLSATPSHTGPGSAVKLGVHVGPSASGPVTLVVERFDPTSGWQLVHRYEVRASGGSATVSFRPPSVGRYRARATFTGTRVAAGSASRLRGFRVEAPLTE